MTYPVAKIIDAEKGIVEVTPRRKKVAIIGGSTSRVLVPCDDDWEIWSLNEQGYSRQTRHFEIHELHASSDEEVEWLKKCKQPIYMCEKYPEIPMSVTYPLREIIKTLGNPPLYFTCTWAYQIALAIYEGFEEIGMFGANLPIGSPRERTVETACVQYWLGVAQGRGIEVHIPESDSLLYHRYLYGFDYQKEIDYTKKVVASLWGRMWMDVYKNIV